MFQRLGFADSGEQISLRIFDEIIDALECLSVLLLPIQVAVPAFIREL